MLALFRLMTLFPRRRRRSESITYCESFFSTFSTAPASHWSLLQSVRKLISLSTAKSSDAGPSSSFRPPPPPWGGVLICVTWFHLCFRSTCIIEATTAAVIAAHVVRAPSSSRLSVIFSAVGCVSPHPHTGFTEFRFTCATSFWSNYLRHTILIRQLICQYHVHHHHH